MPYVKLRHPRMSPELYDIVRERALAAFNKLFDHVICGPDAPEKTSFGDVDLLLCSPKAKELKELNKPNSAETYEQYHPLLKMKPFLMEQLGAHGGKFELDTLFLYFVFPDDLARRLLLMPTFNGGAILGLEPRPEQETDHGGMSVIHEYEYQVDFKLCPSESWLDWQTYYQAHSDLSDIMYRGLLASGLTSKNSGFYLRNPEIEKESKNNCYVFLSNDTRQVFAFLDLDHSRYQKQFSTETEFFEFIASARFFSGLGFDELRCEANSESGQHQAQGSTQLSHSKLMLTRYQYLRFRDEYLPLHPEIRDHTPDRAKVVNEALAFFDATQRYHVHADNFWRSRKETAFWAKAARILPELSNQEVVRPNMIERTLKAVRAWTTFHTARGHGPSPFLLKEPEWIPEKQPLWTTMIEDGGLSEVELLEWIGEWAKTIDDTEQARTRPARHAKMAEKQARKAELKRIREAWPLERAALRYKHVAVLGTVIGTLSWAEQIVKACLRKALASNNVLTSFMPGSKA